MDILFPRRKFIAMNYLNPPPPIDMIVLMLKLVIDNAYMTLRP